MTREEAITELELFKKSALVWNEVHLSEAVDMAIEALHREEAEEKGYCHRINYTPKPCEDANCDCVDVVRCKDCRHRDLFSCPLADNDFQKDDDFCSWGERREP